MSRKTLLSEAVRCALLVGVSAVAGSSFAYAQDKAATTASPTTTLGTVEVTGSRIKRVDAETSAPVFEIDRQAIEKSGALTIGNFIQSVPSVAGAATNPSVNNGGGDGASTVSLRGLGEKRTLILINGRRIITKDVNSIPMSMVERVEILKEGASVAYGSDAMGGVVNFILKKQADGGVVTANYGISSHSDGERVGLSSTWGTSTDRGSLILSSNYNIQQEVKASDRAFSAAALSLGSTSSTGVQDSSKGAGSSRGIYGRYVVPSSITGLPCSKVSRNAAASGSSISDYHCFTNADRFNYQAVGNLELTPQERLGFFVTGNYDFSDSVSGYLDAFVNRTRSQGQIAPLPFDGRIGFDSVPISKDNLYNPFGVDITDSRLRLTSLGNRQYKFETKVNQLNAGLKGFFGDSSWSWDVGFGYGAISQDNAVKGYVSTPALTQALGPSMLVGGVPTCVRVAGNASTAIAGCTPVNMFGSQDPATAAGQAFIKAISPYIVNPVNHTDQHSTGFHADFSGDLFDLSAGTVQGAFGFEYRKESYTYTPDPLGVLNTTTFNCQISGELCSTATDGEVNSKDLYGEILLPLLKDAPFAKELNVTLGTRYSNYNLFGSTWNSKIGIEWRPISELLVRGTYSEVFRSPNISELFQGATASSDGYTDPCNGFAGPATPGCVNVPTDGSFHQSDTQLSAYHTGNAYLKPETGHVATFGVVYEPTWLNGFSTTVDFWRAHLTDTVTTIGTQTILDQCFNSSIANPSPLCSLFSRDSGGEMVRLFDNYANVGVTDTDGVDVGFRYTMDTDYGKFHVNFDSTYIDQYNKSVIVDGVTLITLRNAGTFLSSANGGEGNYSRVRALGSLQWTMGNWDAQWNIRYISGFTVGSESPDGVCANLGLVRGSPGCQLSFGANTYHNVQAGYKIDAWNLQVRMGIDNAFDKQPAILYQNNTLNGNIDERTHDAVGRYFWTSVTFDFK